MEDKSSIDGVFDELSAALAASSNFFISASGEDRVLLSASQDVMAFEVNVLLFNMKGSTCIGVDNPDKMLAFVRLALDTNVL
jgi:hypothetical protein